MTIPVAFRIPTRDREIEGGSGLAHIARREIDRDARDRKSVIAITHCGVTRSRLSRMLPRPGGRRAGKVGKPASTSISTYPAASTPITVALSIVASMRELCNRVALSVETRIRRNRASAGDLWSLEVANCDHSQTRYPCRICNLRGSERFARAYNPPTMLDTIFGGSPSRPGVYRDLRLPVAQAWRRARRALSWRCRRRWRAVLKLAQTSKALDQVGQKADLRPQEARRARTEGRCWRPREEPRTDRAAHFDDARSGERSAARTRRSPRRTASCRSIVSPGQPAGVAGTRDQATIETLRKERAIRRISARS